MMSAGTMVAVVYWARATCAMKIVNGHGKLQCTALLSDCLVDLNLSYFSLKLTRAAVCSNCSC